MKKLKTYICWLQTVEYLALVPQQEITVPTPPKFVGADWGEEPGDGRRNTWTDGYLVSEMTLALSRSYSQLCYYVELSSKLTLPPALCSLHYPVCHLYSLLFGIKVKKSQYHRRYFTLQYFQSATSKLQIKFIFARRQICLGNHKHFNF